MHDSNYAQPDGAEAHATALMTSLATAAASAFKPDFADVVARAARRRRRRPFGIGLAVLGLVAAGGTTFAVAADHTPSPVKPAPRHTVGPWHTVVPQPGDGGPKPQPKYAEVQPGLYDVTEPDKPLTGLFTELQAGDINHLYLEYQKCAGKTCQPMLASSVDRGRTWRKLPLPAAKEPGWEGPSLTMVYGSLVLEGSSFLPRGSYNPDDLPDPTYWVSTDSGVSWRRPTVRTVDALPSGWLVKAERNGIVAVDPATGDMARIKPARSVIGYVPFVIETPPRAGIWILKGEQGPVPSPLPTGGYQSRGRVVAKVSRDGGRTWDIRPLPDAVQPEPGTGWSLDHAMLFTVDGQTVYLAEKTSKDSVRIHASTDGGRTWAARAKIDLNGPKLSLLPVGDRTVIVEGVYGTYRSTDQGRTFTRVGPSLGARAHAIPGGYTIPTNNNEYSAWLSPDGAEWTYIHRPVVP